MTEERRRNSVFLELGSKHNYMLPVVHDAPKAKQMLMWKGKANMWEFHPILGKEKPRRPGTICIYVEGWDWTETNTAVGFQRQKEGVGYLPKDLMKLLFNPYKNVGVYVENVHRTFFFFQYSMKKGNDFQMCAYVRSAFMRSMLRLFVCRTYFSEYLIIMDYY